ncbi:venom protease-like [Battus philenor]|uniref:venom protease-like n=1 Tax=Battus philenor TaxID=42288 RepID=UPI0035D015C3
MTFIKYYLIIFTLAIFEQTAYGQNVPKPFKETENSRPQNFPAFGGNNKFTTFNANLLNYQKTTENPELEENNPCNYKEIEKPNFEVPGRRISEAKCFEYIWEVKRREDDFKQSQACFYYKLQHQNPKPHYAIGGRITEPGEFPHMGAVGWKSSSGTWIFKCGSSLISSNFMLTAAHCSKVSSRDTTVANTVPEIVRLGDKNIIDVYANGLNPVDVRIKKIIVHPLYKAPKKYNDIAIIELQSHVTFNKYVQPACLWTKFDTSPLGTKATLTGWGVIETARLLTSPELQAAEVDIFDSKVCDDLLKPSCSRLWCGMNETQLCAGKLSGGVDACQGDSGGPLQVRIDLPTKTQGAMHYVIGVTSFGIGCARANTSGVYTRVSSFIDWIEDVVWLGNTS